MEHLKLTKEGSVFVLTMIDEAKDNTFTSRALEEFNMVFDEIEKARGNATLVITSSHPKMWCNGINLQWLSEQSKEDRDTFLYNFRLTLLRAALLNLPTIGCLTGHCFAGGAILACAMDFRFMRTDRGRFSLPEVNYGMPLGDTLYGIINSIPATSAVHRLVLTGVAWKGEECLANQVVSALYSEQELFPKTLEFAMEMTSKNRDNYAGLKNDVKKYLSDMWKAKHIQ
jgi:Delta3-Delta2-enoyl-CoA isomerase